MGASRYSTFGFLEPWLADFFSKMEDWFENNTLGPIQKLGMINWLKDAELIDDKKKSTDLTTYLKSFYYSNKNLVWSILWTNLYYGSELIKWYLNSYPWDNDAVINREDLITDYQGAFGCALRSAKNDITSLLKTQDESPLGNKLQFGITIKKGRSISGIKKRGSDDIDVIAIGYCLLKYCSKNNLFDFSLSEIYEKPKGGPFIIFGISKAALKNKLIWLSEKTQIFENLNLSTGLDNISLNSRYNEKELFNLLHRISEEEEHS